MPREDVIHYVPDDLGLWHNKRTLCGVSCHYMTRAGKLIYSKANIRKVTCKNCKRILKSAKNRRKSKM